MEKENLGNKIVQFVDSNLERVERIQSLVEKNKDQSIEFGRIEKFYPKQCGESYLCGALQFWEKYTFKSYSWLIAAHSR